MVHGLRMLLVIDAAVLFLLGLVLIVSPQQVALVFHFQNLPEGVNYLVGLWGCALLTMAGGYLAAAQNPFQHLIWVQVGIVRGALECLLGLVYLGRGIVTFQQAGFGIVLTGLLAVAYILLYPREHPLPTDLAPPTASAS
jgi:hypothetical protein